MEMTFEIKCATLGAWKHTHNSNGTPLGCLRVVSYRQVRDGYGKGDWIEDWFTINFYGNFMINKVSSGFEKGFKGRYKCSVSGIVNTWTDKCFPLFVGRTFDLVDNDYYYEKEGKIDGISEKT